MYHIKWLYRSSLALAWGLLCNLIPVSWWIEHHESKGWRADVWIWFHAIWYGLEDRVTELEHHRREVGP